MTLALRKTFMTPITYNSPNRLIAGYGSPVRVNLSIGSERLGTTRRELEKLRAILQSEHCPDMLMDLSVVDTGKELWQCIGEHFTGPIGILPHYLSFNEDTGLDAGRLFDRIRWAIEGGVNFITVHCTPTPSLLQLAKQRLTPVTSRGGGLIIRDMLMRQRQGSVYAEIFTELCDLARQNHCVLNLGTTFRAPSVAAGLDQTCIAEIREQSRFIELAHDAGVSVVLEGPGHIQLHQIEGYWKLIEPLRVVPMPLGPIVTASDPAMDHVAAAIGAAAIMQKSRGGIINAITSVEHQGGVPSLSLSLEGLRTARVAAQAASLTYCGTSLLAEEKVARLRAIGDSCVIGSKEPGCARCSTLCPLAASPYNLRSSLMAETTQ